MKRIPAVVVLGLCVLGLFPARRALGGEEVVDFSFDGVDIGAFVQLVGEVTGRQFVIAEGVEGRITVVSPQVRREAVFPLFVSILEAAGCSVVVEPRGLHRVVRLSERAAPSAPVVGTDGDIPEQGIVTKVFLLRHVSAGEMRKLLEAGVSGGRAGGIGALEETNHLVLTDTAESVRRLARIIEDIDRPGASRVMRVVRLKYIGAEELAEQLNRAMAEGATRGEWLRARLPAVEGPGSPSGQVGIVASPHSNSVILSGSPSRVAEMERLIEQMDVDAPSGRGRLNAIFLKYLSAEEAAVSIDALLHKGAERQTGPGPRRIAIEASVANNALLIDAMPGDYALIRDLVAQLDHPVEQVHIEVLIVEHTMSAGLQFGVQMAALGAPAGVGNTVVQGSSVPQAGADRLMDVLQNNVIPSGLTIQMLEGIRLDAEGNVVAGIPGVLNLQAIRSDGRFDVLSETSLEAQNNREASVRVVDEIPVLRSTIQGGSGTARDVIQNIDRIDVGIELKLTPRIIPGGEVQMVLNPTIEAVIQAQSGNLNFTPTIAKREVSTTVTVPDGETIVIAGLTRENRIVSERRIPVLGAIPLLGWLFRDSVDTTEKTDVVIFVTPRIVSGTGVAPELRRRWRERTGLVEPGDAGEGR